MSKFRIIIPVVITVVSALLSGCGGINVEEGKAITTVDLRAMQTREFDTTKEVAIGAVIEMFQDLGLVVDELNEKFGLVSTKAGPLNFNPKTEGSINVLGLYLPTPGNQSEDGQGSANIQETGKSGVRIRVNFNKIAETSTTTTENSTNVLSLIGLPSSGQTKKTSSSTNRVAVTNADFYRAVFEKIEKSIFIKENQ